jgi:hypothetical protein
MGILQIPYLGSLEARKIEAQANMRVNRSTFPPVFIETMVVLVYRGTDVSRKKKTCKDYFNRKYPSLEAEVAS